MEETMSDEMVQQFYTAFPELFRRRHLPKEQSGFAFGFECGSEWFEVLWQHCQYLEAIAVAEGRSRSSDEWPEARQVKWKIDSLRFYIGPNASPVMRLLCRNIGKALMLWMDPANPAPHGWIAITDSQQAKRLIEHGDVWRVHQGGGRGRAW
jgi:hypothetical protein